MTDRRRLYTTTARTRPGAAGVRIDGEDDPLPVARRDASGGADGGAGWAPEQLYAAALASCMQQAVTLAASMHGVDPDPGSVTAEVSLESDGALRYAMDASVRIELPHLDESARQAIVTEATRSFPMAKGVRIDGL